MLTAKSNTTINSMLCADESISVNGRTYNVDNPSGREELQTVTGCDSTIVINLFFYDELSVENIPVSLCVGDTLRYNDEAITAEAGMYERIFPTQDGACDSLQILWDVRLVTVDSTVTQDTICLGDVLEWNSLSLTLPGRYQAVRSSISGDCELLEVLYLTVIKPDDIRALDDFYALQRSDESLLMPLQLNDTLPYPFNIEIIEEPEKGQVEFMGQDVFFVPDGEGFGLDSFRYKVCFAQCPDFCQQAWVRLDIDFNCALEFTLNIPSGFTPNGDGKNDLFDPLATITSDCLDQLGEARMAIRNIQSEIVFETGGAYRPWDGTNKKGEALPIGTYWYIFEIEGQDDAVSGAVELVR
jgi:gliding motility-associated-like protein